MKIRCPSCQQAFVVSDQSAGTAITCPSCNRSMRLRTAEREVSPGIAPAVVRSDAPGGSSTDEGVSVFIPSGSEGNVPPSTRGWKRLAAFGLFLLLVVSGLAAWPWIKERFGVAEPKDPVERVARNYLKSLEREDTEQAERLSVLRDLPAIQSFGSLERQRDRDETLKGSFAPIARLNRRIDEDFNFDPKIGRFTPKNPMGPAAETLDALHASKEQAEKSGLYDKMASGNPDDLFDAAESYGKVFTQLAEGALAPKRILPSYEMLIKEAKPPLPEVERELALDYGQNREVWDAMLKRPFLSLRADGPYILDRAEVLASVHDRLASPGDPPTTMRLKLMRFRLEGIDTGWKIVAAERVLPNQPEPNLVPDSSKPSPTSPRQDEQGSPGSSGSTGR